MEKAQYAILRFAKYKGPEIGRIEAHDERTKEKYAKASVQRQLELARKLQEFEALQQTVQDLEGDIAAIPPEIREKYKTESERKETFALE